MGVKLNKGDQVVKDKALGFLKKWRDDLTLIHITAMMIDILGVYQAFEKRMQTDHVIIPDIIRYRDQAVEKFKLFQELGYLPGGKLDLVQKRFPSFGIRDPDAANTPRTIHNTLVPSFRTKSFAAIKHDTLVNSINRFEH